MYDSFISWYEATWETISIDINLQSLGWNISFNRVELFIIVYGLRGLRSTLRIGGTRGYGDESSMHPLFSHRNSVARLLKEPTWVVCWAIALRGLQEAIWGSTVRLRIRNVRRRTCTVLALDHPRSGVLNLRALHHRRLREIGLVSSCNWPGATCSKPWAVSIITVL
jgi:hypothetical protein